MKGIASYRVIIMTALAKISSDATRIDGTLD